MLPKGLAYMILYYLPNYNNNYDLVNRLVKVLNSNINGTKYEFTSTNGVSASKLLQLIELLNHQLNHFGFKSIFRICKNNEYMNHCKQHSYYDSYSFVLKDNNYQFSPAKTKILIAILFQVYHVNLINKVIKKFRSKTAINFIKVKGKLRHRHVPDNADYLIDKLKNNPF